MLKRTLPCVEKINELGGLGRNDGIFFSIGLNFLVQLAGRTPNLLYFFLIARTAEGQ